MLLGAEEKTNSSSDGSAHSELSLAASSFHRPGLPKLSINQAAYRPLSMLPRTGKTQAIAKKRNLLVDNGLLHFENVNREKLENSDRRKEQKTSRFLWYSRISFTALAHSYTVLHCSKFQPVMSKDYILFCLWDCSSAAKFWCRFYP